MDVGAFMLQEEEHSKLMQLGRLVSDAGDTRRAPQWIRVDHVSGTAVTAFTRSFAEDVVSSRAQCKTATGGLIADNGRAIFLGQVSGGPLHQIDGQFVDMLPQANGTKLEDVTDMSKESLEPELSKLEFAGWSAKCVRPKRWSMYRKRNCQQS